MPSKRCYFHPDCKSFVFGLPRDTGLREQWLKFIFNSVPDHYNPNLAVCATHFTQGSFQNVNEFKAGFARRLLLKDGAVPTLKDEAAVFGAQPQQKSAMIDLQYSLQYSLMAPRRSIKNGVEDSTGSSDEDMDICDRDSVASSVDSTAEEMFMDGLDSILDQPSPDLYPPEEDCDSEASQQQRKRFCLSSPSSAADGGGRESGNYNLSGVSSERWHNSDEADVEPLQLDFSPVQEPGPKFLPTLHLSDSREDEMNNIRRGTAAYERLGKIQPLYQVIREACKTFFHPFQNITIVERMVTSEARTGVKRCMKNESPNMGYKLFALTDCTCGYTWDFFVYEGKSCTSQSEGLSYESVMALVDENMLGSGYKLFVDKFYTSPTLFRGLLCKKIWACGPVWANRTGFPKTTRNRLPRNAPRGTMRWIRNNKLLFVEWKDSQEVQMCSTFHKAYKGDTVQRKMKGDAHRTLVEVPIPAVVLDYNKNVEAVDLSNCITGHYRAIHKPKKWYHCVFYHFLDITIENAFIMQEQMAKRKNMKPLTRKSFLEVLILELAEMGPRDSAPVSSAPSSAVPL